MQCAWNEHPQSWWQSNSAISFHKQQRRFLNLLLGFAVDVSHEMMLLHTKISPSKQAYRTKSHFVFCLWKGGCSLCEGREECVPSAAAYGMACLNESSGVVCLASHSGRFTHYLLLLWLTMDKLSPDQFAFGVFSSQPGKELDWLYTNLRPGLKFAPSLAQPTNLAGQWQFHQRASSLLPRSLLEF